MYGHWRTDLASHRGELSATTSEHRVLVVIAEWQSSANYAVVVHLADKHENNSLFNKTWFNIASHAAWCGMPNEQTRIQS